MEDNELMNAYLNDFAERSFRNVADQDYINARLCYRNGLMHQYSWAALQAIEKLLKGILLFNRVDSKDLGHKLIMSYERIQRCIPDLDFCLPDDCLGYLRHLDNIGENRYLTKAHYNKRNEILRLDKTVWLIRRYCQNIRQTISIDGVEKDTFKAKLKLIQNLENTRCCQNVTHNGHLEKVVSELSHAQRDALVWQNFYFNSEKLEQVAIPSNSNSINPTHTLHLEIFEQLEKLVAFSRDEKKDFRAYIKAQNKK